jgi:hypothetical protein
MLWFVRTKASDRKTKLFDVASCRLIWDSFDEQRRRRVEAWERFAEGEITREELNLAMSGSPHDWSDPCDYAWDAAIAGGGAAQANLLRDIIGNPFHPVSINPASLTPTVSNFAAAAYEERELPKGHLDAALLGVLADALEDAGCDNAELLGHLRGPGRHVRGCWALDVLLGKE